MARKEGKKAKGAGARALASVAVTLRVTTTPAALNAPLQGASIRHSGCATVGKGDRCGPLRYYASWRKGDVLQGD
ncbi:hypothetical protein CIP106467_0780 [Citrobacter europaeus]|nr:hypothetical protein CI00_06105 [Leptospira interrogans serovar Manilae]KIN80012.1 hypothetical protein SD74_17715 [Clostridium botulinum]OPD28056.1 hypothetical protein AL711_18020 [Clostridium botulinum]CAD7560570.1 hypothetical protein CIP106467_0780 [Citrobacter europaeus]